MLKKIISYEHAAEELKILALDAGLDFEMEKAVDLENAASKLSGWLADGKAGPCPVDLASYGLEVIPDGAAEIASEGSAASTSQEAPEPIAQEQDFEMEAVTWSETPSEIYPPEERTQAEEPQPNVSQEIATAQPEMEDLRSAVEDLPSQADESTAAIKTEESIPEEGERAEEKGAELKSVIKSVDGTAKGDFAAEPEAEDEMPIPFVEIETPEQAELKRQLSVARQHLESGELREAAALSKIIAERAGSLPDVLDSARDIHDQAQSRLNEKMRKAIAAGDQARKKGREEDARKHYQAALEMDPENDHAHRALLELDYALDASLSEGKRIKIKGGLKERRNIKRLGEAVYEAEALDEEDKLPASMVELLKAARQYYDTQRIDHSEVTTMMRFGDLAARKKARDKIAEFVAQSQEFLFDATINQNTVAPEVLEEADKLYELESEDTAQYEISRIEFLLPGYPRAAIKHLRGALEKPFFEKHTQKLENKLAEIEKLLQGQEAAEALLNQARLESDALKILDLVSQARAVFNDLPGINERLETSRRTARDTMAAGMRSHYSQAETLVNTAGYSSGKVKYEIYKQARQEATASEALLAKWPESEKPKELLDLTQSGEQLMKRVDEEESLTREFEGKVDTILKQVGDDATRAAGMALFGEIHSDPRFVKFPDMRELNGLMDQYRDIREQLEEAKLARREREWQRTYKLSREIIDSGKAGQWLGEVEDLLKESELELGIQEAQQALEKDYIQEANRVLSKLIKGMSESASEELKERLKGEYSKINQAIDDTPPMQKLFDQAGNIKDHPSFEHRIQALRYYRYVAGDPTEPRQEGWPEYRLSLRTADARREARELGEKLRVAWLPALEATYAERESAILKENELAPLAERARWLREANLIEHEEQRKAMRWAEMGWELQRVAGKELNGSWEEVERILKDLNINYPRQPEIEGRLHNARIQRLVAKTNTMISSGDIDAAVSLLTSDEVEEDLRNTPEVMLALTEAYANQNDFVQAFNVLTQTSVRYPNAQKAINQKEAEIRARQAWQVNKIESWDLGREGYDDSEWSINGPAEALEIIQKAIEDGNLENADALVKLQKDYFDRSKEYLIVKAGKKQNQATRTSKVDAVIALLDLLRLEEILGLPEAIRESQRRVKPMCDSFVEVARALIDSVDEFEDQLSIPIKQALNETEQLHSRMQALLKAATIFKVNIGLEITSKVQKHVASVEEVRENLMRAEKMIGQVSKDELWTNALRKGDFDDLRQIDSRLEKLKVGFISEIKYFSNKLKEWQEIHDRLAESIAKVRKLFTDGNFYEVIESLDETKNLSEQRNDGRPWNMVIPSHIQAGTQRESNMAQVDYQYLRHVMETRLSIQDIYGDQELMGWDAVEASARIRLVEAEVWETWSKECLNLMERLSRLGSQVNSHLSSTSLNAQLTDYKAIRDCAAEAIQKQQTGPTMDNGELAKVSSKQAKMKNDERKRRLQSAQASLTYANGMIEKIEKEIESLGGFPTPQKLIDATAQKDWVRLKKLIEQARKIGFIDSQDEKRIEKYQRTLDDGIAQVRPENEDGFFSKIKNWLLP